MREGSGIDASSTCLSLATSGHEFLNYKDA